MCHTIVMLSEGGVCMTDAGRKSHYRFRKSLAVCKEAQSEPLILRGRTIFVADAHRGGKRFVVHADEKLTAFLELESAVRSCGGLP